jgi:hypothetical protein
MDRNARRDVYVGGDDQAEKNRNNNRQNGDKNKTVK